MATRINKYLSEVGYCSRRVADRLIEEGKVTINGYIPEIGAKVKEGDKVEVKGQLIEKSNFINDHLPILYIEINDRALIKNGSSAKKLLQLLWIRV